MTSLRSLAGLTALLLLGLAPPLAAQTTTLPAVADTYVRQGSANQNQGQETVLRVQQSGNNRALVRMDQAAIVAAVGNGSLASATLELYVSSSGSWGSTGRTVDVHRLTAAWTEAGATWNCAEDTNPANSQPNCATQWAGGSFEADASDSVLHTNGTAGRIQINVTADVRAFLAGTPNFGWLAKLADETSSGNADYGSRQGTSDRAPRLVLVVERAGSDAVPPSLAITSPPPSVIINDTTPAIVLAYGDGGSGVALNTLAVQVDGVAAVCAPGPASATCEPAPLAEGSHTITVSLRDQAGNQATASRAFTLLLGPGRRSTSFPVVADTYLRQGQANQASGGETTLRLRQSGKNRTLVRFDAAEIARIVGQGTLASARLELTIDKNGRNWGRDGRTVGAHRLTANWTEAGATWNCAIDTQPANSQADCSPQWAGGTFQAAPTASVLHTNDLAGTVSFDVTADVAALLGGTAPYGWLIKKTAENESGLVDYASREAGAANAPRLVIFFDVPASGDTTPPTLAITAPGALVVGDTTPEIRLEYADAGSGIDLQTLEVFIEGIDVLPGCVVGPASASCLPPALSEGRHRIDVRISDFAGNGALRELTFEITLDEESPLISLLAPPPQVLNDPSPQVLLEYSDAEAGLDLASLRVEVDGLDVTATCTTSPGAATCEAPDLEAGGHLAIATIADLQGNVGSASLSFELTLDFDPPQLSVAAPEPGASVSDTTPELTLRYSDAGTGADLATLQIQLDGLDVTAGCTVLAAEARCEAPELAAGEHSIAAAIKDRAGNAAGASAAFSLTPRDVEPPEMTLAAPNLVVTEVAPEIRVEYSDAGSGIDPSSFLMLLDGADLTAACSLGAAAASCTPGELKVGSHGIFTRISDLAGNRATLDKSFTIEHQLSVRVTEPASGTLTTSLTVDVSGTVSPAANAVTVGGVAAVVEGGTFVAEDVPLREGANVLSAVASSAAGGLGTDTVTVVRDTLTPQVVIFSPRDGSVTQAQQILVTGEINDPASSSSSQTPPVVRVGGVKAAVEQRAFVVPDFLLQPGENVIEVDAVDAAGNAGKAAVRVTYVSGAAQRMEEILGNGQTGRVGAQLGEPLVVRLADFAGQPLAGRRVRFEVTRGNGQVRSFPDAGASVEAITDSNGIAQAFFALGERSGRGNHEVTATSPGVQGEVVFCASAEPTSAQRIKRIVGNNMTGAQVAIAGGEAPYPLLTQVFDDFGNPVAGADVTYTVIAGGGHFAGEPSYVTKTDSWGKASATFNLGPLPGINNNLVEATVEGIAETGALFNFTAVAPREGDTTLSGLLLDNQDAPVPGVTLHIGDRSTVADAQGRFTLTGLSPGTVHLGIDGETATRPGRWPHLGFEFTLVRGIDNSLGMPIRLLPIDVASGRIVGGAEDVKVPMSGVPGAELTVFANSVTFPDGSKVGEVTFTQVHGDKVPMIAPMGSVFMLAFTIQPPGAVFDPPARIAIPNLGGKPGTVVDMFSFDHDLGEFITAGTAMISADGRQLMSTPGSGISKAGWGGCVAPPPPDTDVCNPSDCTVCPPGAKQPVPKCDSCHTCNGGNCEPKTIESAKARANGEEEKAITAKDKDVRFSAEAEGNCSDKDFLWDFGDGETSEDESPLHAYKEPGKYTVRVTINCKDCPDSGGASDEIEVVVVKVDLGIQGLGEKAEKADQNEEDPGAFLSAPTDEEEGDLVPFTVRFEGEGVDKGEMTLDASGSSKIRVYEGRGRGTPLTLPKTWMITNGNREETLSIEGVKGSDTFQDVELTVTYNQGGPVTEDKAKVTVLAVEITKPTEKSVRLEGEEVRWVAKLKPADLPGQQVNWQFTYLEGTGRPASGAGDPGTDGGRLFDSTPGGHGPIKIKAEVTVDQKTVSAESDVEVVRPELTEVSFSNDFSMGAWVTGNLGRDFVDPVWRKSLGGEVILNDPVAYVRSQPGAESNAVADLRIEAVKTLTELTMIRVRGRGEENFAMRELPVQSWKFRPGELQLTSSPLRSGLDVYDPPLSVDWEYVVRKQDGSFPPWSEALPLGASKHRIYTTFARPLEPFLFDLALEKAIFTYARNEVDPAMIAKKVMEGIEGNIYYLPPIVHERWPLEAYEEGAAVCWTNADLMALLLRSVGIAAEVRFFYGGRVGTAAIYNAFGKEASARFKRPPHEGAACLNPDFTYHAQTRVAGIYYDPSYGLVGQAKSLHVCQVPGVSFVEDGAFLSVKALCLWTDNLHAECAAE